MDCMGEFLDSTSISSDGAALRERMHRDGYLFIRELLPASAVLSVRRRLLAKAAPRPSQCCTGDDLGCLRCAARRTFTGCGYGHGAGRRSVLFSLRSGSLTVALNVGMVRFSRRIGPAVASWLSWWRHHR